MSKPGADKFGKQQSELLRKILWTLGLLAVYRIGIHVPVPGVNIEALSVYFAAVAQNANNLVGMIDMFSGGALSQLPVFALGVMPYISASIIMQLLQVIFPDLKRIAKEEGAAGRKKITQYTRYGTVLITAIQGFGLAMTLEGMITPNGMPIILDPGWGFRLITIVTLIAGTSFIMWLGEQITEKGIGNGISLIIFSGIVAGIPKAIFQSVSQFTAGELHFIIPIVLLVIMAVVLVFIVFVERGQRRIPIHYAKRQIGRKVVGGQNTHLPLRINTAGVIPPIFASTLLIFPATIASFSTIDWVKNIGSYIAPDGLLYNLMFIILVVLFCFFYTAIIFDPKDIAENLKKQGGFVPGIRPGANTAEYINRVLLRITPWGAAYICAVCLLPMLLRVYFNVPFQYGGTSLLILVGVAMDFMSQVQSHMISTQYESLLGKTKIKGRY